MFFKIASDSMWMAAVRRDCSPARRYAQALTLLWLAWLFGPAWTGEFPGFSGWLAPTVASIPVFLALYGGAYFGSRRRAAGYVLAIAVLGAALTPVNPFAETYLIFACAVAAFCRTPRQSFRLMAILLALYSLEWVLLSYPLLYLLNFVVIALIVGITSVYKRVDRERQAEVKLSHDEIRRLAATAERERIGRDLHDLLGHTLSLVAVKSELAKRLLERDPQAARKEIAEVERVARDALSQVRSAVTGIRAACLAAELASARLLLESAGVVFDYRPPAQTLPEQVETTLALVLREAVTNIQRHAGATRAEVSVERERGRAILRVRDNGRGGVGAHGNGLTGMRERVETLYGSLAIRSERGHGTELTIALPLPDAESADSPKAARGSAPAATVGQLKHA
jgi:two-component system sensor histidine kinase DesK